MFYNYYRCRNSKDQHICSDTFIVNAVSRKYKYKLDPSEISSIQQSIAESKLPEGVPLVKSYSWWEIFQYGQKPFETKAWKKYIQQKYGKE